MEKKGETISIQELKHKINDNGEITQEELEELERIRPKTRADCVNGQRPCPFVSCRYHLFLDIGPSGSIKFNFPDKELGKLKETCVLDVAERKGATLDEIGKMMNLTRERIRQIEKSSINCLVRKMGSTGFTGMTKRENTEYLAKELLLLATDEFNTL